MQAGPEQREKREQTTGDTHRVAVLGATGSIGLATMDVLAELNRCDDTQSWHAWAISGHQNTGELIRLAAEADPKPSRLVASDPSQAERLSRELQTPAHPAAVCQLDVGEAALVRAAEDPAVDTVIAAIVGRAGLESTLAAVKAGKRLALANKETLVVAGPVVMEAARESETEILPVDSEHSAIFQCLAEARGRSGTGPTAESEPGRHDGANEEMLASARPRYPGVRRLILTASGGPFRDWTFQQMREATVDEALDHPTWQMGRKITIDSASMMNKALEIIEAKWLFDVPAESIEVVVHPQSLIHSLVEFEDGSLVAQLSPPDMRLPIQYALTYPRRLPCPAPPLDRAKPWQMSLQPADLDRFPALRLGFEVAEVGGTAGAVVNGANETAVALFLDGKIRFTDIVPLCRQVLQDHHHESSPSLSTLLALDRWSRTHASKLAERMTTVS